MLDGFQGGPGDSHDVMNDIAPTVICALLLASSLAVQMRGKRGYPPVNKQGGKSALSVPSFLESSQVFVVLNIPPPPPASQT